MMAQKALVLDANILIRAVLGNRVRGLLEAYASEVHFFTPGICFQDAQKYLPIIFRKRGLSAEPALDVLQKRLRVLCNPLILQFIRLMKR